MKCEKCDKPTSDKVIDSRELTDGTAIRRRRECLICGHRMTTYEREAIGVLQKQGLHQQDLNAITDPLELIRIATEMLKNERRKNNGDSRPGTEEIEDMGACVTGPDGGSDEAIAREDRQDVSSKQSLALAQ